ncbi:MAG: hypothetical protein JXM68_03455 [Sedimentisphaerales bacterium]|nr:hypothetical protein [Sedimentisphaerales bacterium]
MKKYIKIAIVLLVVCMLAKGITDALWIKSVIESYSVLNGIGSATCQLLDKNGKMPDTLKELVNFYDPEGKNVFCPICYNEYKYYGQGGKKETSGDVLVVFCDCTSPTRGYFAAFFDGHALDIKSAEKMVDVLEKNNKLRLQCGMKPIDLAQVRYNDTMSLADYAAKNAAKR